MSRWKPILLIAAGVGVGIGVGWCARGRSFDSQMLADANVALAQRNFDLAIRLAQTHIRKSDLNHPDAERIVSRALALQERWSESCKSFEQTVLRSAEDYALYVKALYHSGRAADSLKVLRTGLEAFPLNPRLAELETRILATSHRTKESMASAEKLLHIPGKELCGRLILGMIHFETKNYGLAAEQLRKAIELSPELEGQSEDFPKTSPDFVNEIIAVSLLKTESEKDALDYARSAYLAAPNAVRALLAAKAAAARKDSLEVRKWVDLTLQSDPKNFEALVMRIDSALEEGRIDEAQAALEETARLNVLDPGDKHMLSLSRARIDAARRRASAGSERR